MPSIGNIVVKRIIEHKLLPPVYEPIVKGPSVTLEQSQPVPHLVTPSLIGAGGESPKAHKEVLKFISQTVALSESINRVKVSGVVGISYTQTSFTFESYTIAGVAVTKSLSETITITEPLSVQRSKKRVVTDSDASELSETLTAARRKARALTQSTGIAETLTIAAPTLRELIETQTVSDSVVAVKSSRRTLVQSEALDDNVAILLPGIRNVLVETVSILEALEAEVTHVGGLNITKSLSDTINISEAAITRRTAFYRALAQSIALGDSLVKLLLARRSYSRSFTLISYTSSARAEKSLSEFVGESHTLRMALTKNRNLPAQSVNLSEQVTAIVTRARVADIVSVTDEVERSVGTSKVLGDTIIISDLLTATQADIVAVSDTVVRVIGKNRGLSQSVTITG
jgi:hypothetical protein